MSQNLSTTDFLSELQNQGITLWVDGDNLRFNAPKNGLTPELRAQLVGRKTEIITLLRPSEATQSGTTSQDAWQTPNKPSAPQTPTESAITAVWQKLLGVSHANIHANFFEQGGDSILATQIVSWIRQTYGVDITLRALFTNPTIAGLAKNIEHANKVTHALNIQPLQQSEKENGSVLSFAQQRSWFLDQLTPENPFYNMPKTLHLQGQLNVDALAQTLDEISRRHETLRTQFIAVDGQPRSFVIPHKKLELQPTNLQHLPAEARMAAAEQLLVTEVQRPFDLTRGTLIRPYLIQLAPQEHILLLTMHHIASDGWSTGVLLREIAALYPTFCNNKPTTLPELPIQYADFAAWQRNWLKGDKLEAHLSYWQAQLRDLPTLEIPTDRPRPPMQTVIGARTWFELPPTLTHAIEALSQKEGVTLFMSLLATFQTLLHRYSTQDDIVIGSPIANRNHAEIENLIGFFANMLVLRTDFSNNPTFLELLQQVRDVALAAYEHQDLPFEKLVEELQPERDLSRTPLFQVVFALQNAPMRPLEELPQLTLKSLPLDKGTAAYDLNMAMWRADQTLKGRIEYNIDLFDEATISRFIAHFQQLLEAMVNQPNTPVANLTFLTKTELQQFTEWNSTQKAYEQNECIHSLVSRQAAKTPTAVAVTFAGKSLTYQALDQKANQLAHHLQTLGVGPDTSVGLCVERSLEMLIGLLGILKAGGAYLPLDPAFPEDRLTYMVDDAQLPIILTQQSHLDNQLLTDNDCLQIPLDAAHDTFAQYPTDAPETAVSPSHLAYTIYTSGSTGWPKGVQITHKTVINFLQDMSHQPGVSQQDTLLSVTTLSFDIAVLELFLPLIVGAKVALVSREVAIDGIQLLQEMDDSQATVMQATPATWQLLLAAGWQGHPNLKILCGGEALPPQLANELLTKGKAVWNLYGPTETTIWSARYKVEASVDKVVPIGRPIANTQIYILDKQMQFVPIGVAGEIYIAGDGLARGYRGRPTLTAERFIQDPFSPNASQKMYKTGDLGRYLPDGNIEFIGRNDHQVKIRGFRIELGEIETAVNQHPLVDQVVLATHQDASQANALVAYIIPTNPASPPSNDELRHFLSQTLPDYMIPTAVLFLEAYPLTPNGKIDRKALPAPAREQLAIEHAFVAPSNDFEELMAEIWSEVLKLDRIGIHDNFFNLGGHSLLATQVVSRIRDRFEIALPVRVLFEAPTIAELSERVEQILIAEIEALDEDEAGQLLEEVSP